ncbi:MAG: hypothetical protein ABI823_19915, partial [Bryobacteraceae bacterium]
PTCWLPAAASATAGSLMASSVFAGTLYMGGWPKDILVVDEGSRKVVDRIVTKTGIPRNLQLSADRKKLYVSTGDKDGIEVIDIATRKVISSFILDDGNKRVRFNGFAPDPKDEVLYTITTTAIKEIDRWVLEPPKFSVIDIKQQKIIKQVDYPKEDANAFARFSNLQVSPDGKFLYQFRDQIYIFDTATFKLVEKIDLAKPTYPGMMNVGFGGSLDSIEEPGFHTSIFNAQDPIVHRRIFGIVRFDLTKRTFDFKPVGPQTGGMMGLHITPDKTKGFTVASQGTQGNRRTEFWELDLTTGKLLKTQEFPGRSRFYFALSTDGKELYVYGAGYELDIYDAQTMQKKQTVDLNTDITTSMVALPGR